MATILVADDNSNIQKMVKLALKDQGIEVFSVGNGEAAVRKLPDVQPDLVLADIFMPVRDGYEVCEYIKQDSRFAHIPVILLVGAFDPLDEREAQRVGADGVLKKPFVPPDPLITMVKSVLARSASERMTPVGAAVRAPASAAMASPTMETPAPLEPPVESPAEEYSTHPQRVAFGEGERPVAFGELLAAPTVEVEPEADETRAPESSLGEMQFWQGPATVEEPLPEPEVSEPTCPDPALLRQEEALLAQPAEPAHEEPSASVIEAPALAEPEPAPEMASSTAKWIEAVPAEPAEVPEIEAAAQEEPAAPVEAEPFPTAPPAVELPPVAPPEVELPPMAPTEEEEASGWAEPREESAEPAPAWSSPVAPSALSVEPAGIESELRPAESVQSFEVPQPANPKLVEEVVARVIARMQPQILEMVTREILKPVVEALVRRELEKR